jgi:hypothetical protein
MISPTLDFLLSKIRKSLAGLAYELRAQASLGSLRVGFGVLVTSPALVGGQRGSE